MYQNKSAEANKRLKKEGDDEKMMEIEQVFLDDEFYTIRLKEFSKRFFFNIENYSDWTKAKSTSHDDGNRSYQTGNCRCLKFTLSFTHDDKIIRTFSITFHRQQNHQGDNQGNNLAVINLTFSTENKPCWLKFKVLAVDEHQNLVCLNEYKEQEFNYQRSNTIRCPIIDKQHKYSSISRLSKFVVNNSITLVLDMVLKQSVTEINEELVYDCLSLKYLSERTLQNVLNEENALQMYMRMKSSNLGRMEHLLNDAKELIKANWKSILVSSAYLKATKENPTEIMQLINDIFESKPQ